MKFVIAGGTGFLGNALAWTWAEEGHDVRVLTRSLPPGQSKHEPGTGKPGISSVGWAPDGKAGPAVGDVDGAAAVVNLAGESIAGSRWTAARKQALRDSRIQSTRSLVAAIAAAGTPPPVLISASGAGYYGDRGNEALSENASPGSDFLARLCVEWEAEALHAVRPGVRTMGDCHGGILFHLVPTDCAVAVYVCAPGGVQQRAGRSKRNADVRYFCRGLQPG